MKVVAFNGSARKQGNTEALIQCVLEELESVNMAWLMKKIFG